jgi:transposase-like protein
MEPAFPYERDKFDQTCDYCGARFEVTVPGQKAHEESEEYRCPECSKAYTVRASLTPSVRLTSPRTDGRTTSFPNP